jgi:Na+/phosphate symporter
MPNGPQGSLVISYLLLRKVVGILGLTFPIVVPVGACLIRHTSLQSSLSAYYYTTMGDVFVGTLCAIGIFMFSYCGYEKKDARAGKFACFFAVGVALFPTTPEAWTPTDMEKYIGIAHFTFALGLFVTLIIFSGILFRKMDPIIPPTPKKLQRNKVYLTCAWIMSGCIVGIAAWKLWLINTAPSLAPLEPVFWLESIAIASFGVSWLVKGEAILKDE